MKLVIDTNIVISAAIRESTTRRILLRGGNTLFFPQSMPSELVRHQEVMLRKSGATMEEHNAVLALLLSRARAVPWSLLRLHWKEAEEVMGTIDEDDVVFIACALAIDADAIWTEDTHFLQQSLVKVITTEKLSKIL